MIRALVILIFLQLLFSNMALASSTIEPIVARARLTLENVNLPEKEKMGFAGGTLLFDVNKYISVGSAAYGAVTGVRGGFITIGMAANAQLPLVEHLLFDGGFFLGAGGGRGIYTLAGGGLMLRGHGGLYLTSEKWGNIGAGASYIDFPSGTIHSFQPYISYEYPFEIYIAPNWISQYLDGNVKPASQELAIIYKNYFKSKTTHEFYYPGGRVFKASQKDLGLLGMQWYRYLDNKFFITLESEGAFSGDSTGYMQILIGGGVRQKLFKRSFVKILGQIGTAGGGAVATGGGLLLDGGASLQQYLTNSIYVAVNGDYVYAPNGGLSVFSLGGQVGYGFTTPDNDSYLEKITNSDPYAPRSFRVRATNQTYLQASDNWRGYFVDKNVNNLGVQIDYFLNSNIYLTGQGIAAYEGGAGSYMAGLIGPGVYLPIFNSPLFIDVEGLVAAAGGGGLNFDGGFALQGNAGLGINLTHGLSLMGYYGYLGAVQGAFRANVIGATLGYNFTMFSKDNKLP